MKTLHLNLKKEWFDMIFSGEKPEEYREIKEHWAIRLLEKSYHDDIRGKYRFQPLISIFNILTGYCNNSRSSAVEYGIDSGFINFKNYDKITFSNGYAKNRPQFEIEFEGIEIREGNPKWGAESGSKYFVLKLGKIL
jgi:hypothetical protein